MDFPNLAGGGALEQDPDRAAARRGQVQLPIAVEVAGGHRGWVGDPVNREGRLEVSSPEALELLEEGHAE